MCACVVWHAVMQLSLCTCQAALLQCVACSAAAAAAAPLWVCCDCVGLGRLLAGQLDLNMSNCVCVLFW